MYVRREKRDGRISRFGVIGIPIGNIVSLVAIPFWVQSRIVYKDIFGVRLREYYLDYFKYLAVFLCGGVLTYILSSVLDTGSVFADFVIRVGLCAVVPNALNVAVFWRSEEFGVIRGAALGMLRRVTSK